MDVSVKEDLRRIRLLSYGQHRNSGKTDQITDDDDVPLTGERLRAHVPPGLQKPSKVRRRAKLVRIRSVHGIRDLTAKPEKCLSRVKSKTETKEETTTEKRARVNAVERLTIRQNGGMFPEYWDRQRENVRKQYLAALSEGDYEGPLGQPKVSAKNTAEMLPYLNLSTSSFTMGLNSQVQHGYALKLRFLNHGSGGLVGMAKEFSEYSRLNDCDCQST